MNLQKMSKTALIKELKMLRKYIERRDWIMRISVSDSDPDLEDSFLQFNNIRNQRQLGICQALGVVKSRRDYGEKLWFSDKLPTRETIIAAKKEMLSDLKKIWDN